MNPELKQRLIGALVVTALAAIFIPMLFDDPIDNSGQSVTALNIPETPIATGEVSANKLPTNANQVLNAPDTESGSIVNTNEEAELSTDSKPSKESTTPIIADESDTINTKEIGHKQVDDSVDNNSSTTLDTGIVAEKVKAPTNKPTKSQNKASKLVPPLEYTTEKNTSIEPPVKPLKKTQITPTKPVLKESQLPQVDVDNTEKTVNNAVKPKPEFNRWVIQAGSFNKKENAIALMETIRKQGLPVTIDTTNGPNNTFLYRLKVGPTLDKKHAIEMKAKLDSQKIQSILVGE